MSFAFPLPWWLIVPIASAIAGIAWLSYRRTAIPLTALQHGALVALRALAIGAVVLFLCRPIVLMPPLGARSTVVPVLVDVSRSMGIADADGKTRIDRARAILDRELPRLSQRFTPELYTVGDRMAPVSSAQLTAEARHSDLTGALASARERYRGRRVPAIVLLSDGGDTAQEDPAGREVGGVPIFSIGIGSPGGLRDREVVGITAGEPRVDQDSVDLHVSAVSHGYGRAPFDLRLLSNGREVESRRVVPASDGSPAEEVFTVSPDRQSPTVYTARMNPAPDEAISENNERSALVGPPGRRRRILAIEGAPAFEHSFMMRALAHDPGLDVDSIVRKGANDSGRPTFFVQSGGGRASSLAAGFPATRETLYGYDAAVVANLEGDFFTRAQLQLVSDFVAMRGGGLLVLGGRSFAEHGLIGTPLEEVLPVELGDRRAGRGQATAGSSPSSAPGGVALTSAGDGHPIMRIGGTTDETRKRWAALPPLAGVAALGGARPGASVLAVSAAADGGSLPLVAVQRFGRGRSMVFAGEASWRWRMLLPSTDRTYELFWRQAMRWLAGAAPDPVAITVPDSAEPGDSSAIAIDVRDASFNPADDAVVQVTLTAPGGADSPLAFRHTSTGGRFEASIQPDRPGLYRVRAEARRATTPLGAAERWFYVGNSDREFADPRLNEALLRRVSRASGGRYVRAADASEIVSDLLQVVPQDAALERRDLWHEPWAFALVIVLLSAEWVLRRHWGLR